MEKETAKVTRPTTAGITAVVPAYIFWPFASVYGLNFWSIK